MIYWVWLSKTLGPGNNKFVPLIRKYQTAQAIYKLNKNELGLNSYLTPKEIFRLCNKNLNEARQIVETCKNSGIKIICYSDKMFPNILKELPNPPICLYVKGEFPDFDNDPFVCMVGKRKCSDYGKKVAWSLSARLTLGNITVISGGAAGIDASAHRGALDVDGKTVAILACGINYNYLKENETLRKQISKSGCLISEYAPNDAVFRQNFVTRNRLISALAYGTVVVEAGKGSGAIITANHAVEQGKEVFVITGKPDDPNYYGNNQLLRDGAKPIFEADDIFSEYNLIYGDKILPKRAKDINLANIFNEKYGSRKPENYKADNKNEEKTQNKSKNIPNIENLPLSKNAKMVYNYLDRDFFIFDDLTKVELSFDELLTAVTELELFGLIKAVPGGRYSVLR